MRYGPASACVLLTSGCASAPSLGVLGAYFPDWLFSIVGEILLARDRAPSRKAFRRRKVAVVAFASDRTVALYQRGLADRLATTTSQQQLIAEKLSLVEPEGRTLEEQLVLMTAPGGGYQRFARRALATPSTGSPGSGRLRRVSRHLRL
jgi:hypothetical protein